MPLSSHRTCVRRSPARALQILVWSLRTGRLLEVLSGHEGPVCGLAFSPASSLLASASWDRTVRTWDVFEGGGGGGAGDTLEHAHDVLALALRPDGRMLAAATLDGGISLWDPVEAQLQARAGLGWWWFTTGVARGERAGSALGMGREGGGKALRRRAGQPWRTGGEPWGRRGSARTWGRRVRGGGPRAPS
jgi:hypothetical protein